MADQWRKRIRGVVGPAVALGGLAGMPGGAAGAEAPPAAAPPAAAARYVDVDRVIGLLDGLAGRDPAGGGFLGDVIASQEAALERPLTAAERERARARVESTFAAAGAAPLLGRETLGGRAAAAAASLRRLRDGGPDGYLGWPEARGVLDVLGHLDGQDDRGGSNRALGLFMDAGLRWPRWTEYEHFARPLIEALTQWHARPPSERPSGFRLVTAVEAAGLLDLGRWSAAEDGRMRIAVPMTADFEPAGLRRALEQLDLAGRAEVVPPAADRPGAVVLLARSDYEARVVPPARRRAARAFAEGHRALLLFRLEAGPAAGGIWLDAETDPAHPVYVVPADAAQLAALRRVLQSPALEGVRLHERPWDADRPPVGRAFAVETEGADEHYLVIPKATLDGLQPLVDLVARELNYAFPGPASPAGESSAPRRAR